MARPRSTAASRSQADIAFEQLRHDIVQGQLQPGERLRFAALRARYGVSVGALREALSRLLAHGLVIGESQRGFAVAPATELDVQDVTELRCIIDCMALRKAIERGDMSWEVRVVSALHSLCRTPRADVTSGQPNEEWIERHQAFHHALISGCGTPSLVQMHAILFDLSERYRRLSFAMSVSRQNWRREHKLIAEAALARDADLACLRLTNHILALPRRIERGVGVQRVRSRKVGTS